MDGCVLTHTLLARLFARRQQLGATTTFTALQQLHNSANTCQLQLTMPEIRRQHSNASAAVSTHVNIAVSLLLHHIHIHIPRSNRL